MEPSDDGHFIVIEGRRWRATDPTIAAPKAHDEYAEQSARARVRVAKIALGERGMAWWEQTTDERMARWESGL